MLKKLSVIIGALLLASCTSLNTNNFLKDLGIGGSRDNGPIREIGKEEDTEAKDRPAEKVVEKSKTIAKDEVKTESKKANEENISEYISEVKANLKSHAKREVAESSDSYKVFLGETLVFPVDKGSTLKVTSAPRNTESKVSVANTKGEFRSIYRGKYSLANYKDGTLNKKITVSVNSKYDFSEKDIYDIILRNSEKNNKDLEKAITAYKMLYPAGKNIKNVNYTLLKYGYETKNNGLIKEALASMKNDISSYNDAEKATILKAAKLSGVNINLPIGIGETTNPDLKSALDSFKTDLSEDKNKVTEKIENEIDKVKTSIEDKLPKSLTGASKTANTTNKTTASAGESYYDKAMKSLNSDPKSAIENFKKSLSNEKIQDKKPQIYYNIASSYAKLGNKVEVSKYLRLLKQEFPNSEWAKKAELITNFIK